MPRQSGASPSLMTLDKRSKIMLVVLAVIVVIAAAYFLVFKKSNSSTSNSAPTVTPSHSTAVTPKTTPTPKAKATVTPAQAILADSTRDPFQPLPEEAVPTASSSPSAASSSTPSAAPSSSPSSSAPATGSHTVMALSITGSTASVTYNGTTKTVKAGDSLATGVSVIKINADSIFVSYNNKLYAVAPGQTVTF